MTVSMVKAQVEPDTVHNSTSKVTTKVSPKYTDDPEADYDVNCTSLYKFIEEKKWDEALDHVQKDPIEALTWISRFHSDDRTKLRWRLLPIHACMVLKAPLPLIEALITAYPDACQMKDDQSMLPLHLACRNGASKGVVLILLDTFPAAIDIKDRKGRVAIELAESSRNSNTLVVSNAIKNFASEQKQKASGVNPMKMKMQHPGNGIGSGNRMAEEPVDYDHRTTLLRLVLNKDWDGVSLRCKTAPQEASTFITTKGFKGNLRFLPIHKASVLQPPEKVIELLIAAYPDGPKLQDQDDWVALHGASFYGASTSVIDRLIAANPDGAQAMDGEGRIPLHYACLKGASVKSIKSIVDAYPKGAHRKDHEGRIPMHHACSKGASVEVISLLIKACAKGSISKDDQGRLPIHQACRKNCSAKILKLLLKSYPKGAQVKDDQDKLPIHYAFQSGASSDAIKVLLTAFPHSINSKNGFGHTPLAEARASGNKPIIALVEKFVSHNKHLVESEADKVNAALKTEMTILNAKIKALENTLSGNNMLNEPVGEKKRTIFSKKSKASKTN